VRACNRTDRNRRTTTRPTEEYQEVLHKKQRKKGGKRTYHVGSEHWEDSKRNPEVSEHRESKYFDLTVRKWMNTKREKKMSEMT
jgi:hypothetical protein